MVKTDNRTKPNQFGSFGSVQNYSSSVQFFYFSYLASVLVLEIASLVNQKTIQLYIFLYIHPYIKVKFQLPNMSSNPNNTFTNHNFGVYMTTIDIMNEKVASSFGSLLTAAIHLVEEQPHLDIYHHPPCPLPQCLLQFNDLDYYPLTTTS